MSWRQLLHNPLIIWVNYNELTTSSLEIMVSKGKHPQMALIQVSELLLFTQNHNLAGDMLYLYVPYILR